MDQDVENRFNRLENKMDLVSEKLDCIVRIDERQKAMIEGIRHQGKRLGAQERELDTHTTDTANKFQAYDKSNWKHHAVSNFIERSFWLVFATAMSYLFYNIQSIAGQ